MITHFYVDMDNLTEIEAALGMAKDKSKVVLRAAINSVAKQTEKQMYSDTKKKYRYQQGDAGGIANTVADLKKANRIEKAKAGRLSAAVKVTGRVNELLGFHVDPLVYVPGGGPWPEYYKARATRTGKLQKVVLRPGASDEYKGFIIRYKSGHMALAQRVPGKRMKSNPHKEAVKSLLSISAPKAEEIVYREKVEKDMYELLEKSIEEQIHRFLK
ncbi:MAG: hypothetical protein NC541_10990 [bacterium]|nr:hypothetical protein [bacterium]